MDDTATLGYEVRDTGDGVRVIDIRGDVTPAVEDALSAAYDRASGGAVRAVVLDFTELEYLNSGGIGLLVTLLVRAQRGGHELRAFGLNDHYRQIFELTRLDEAIALHDDEASATATA